MNNRLLLPQFEKPPVSEVALSVEFSPLQNWRSPHAGIYWGRIIDRYPNTQTQPPLPSQIEKFGAEFPEPPQIRVELANLELVRFWFLSEPLTKLIQVQRDRFIVNWRKIKEDEAYPNYAPVMRPLFESEFKEFCDFILNNNIGRVEVQQCELTYVNNILRGDGWNTSNDALKLLRQWWNRGKEDYLPEPESLSLAGSFQMQDERGRLHFSAQRGYRQTDKKEIMQLQLTARGKPASSRIEDVLTWMDLGHEWIVRGFVDLTSPLAHKLWDRRA